VGEIKAFLHDLASAEPVPGGGSVAALEAAMGAALLLMVTNLTIGRKKYASVDDEARRIRGLAEPLCAEALDLVHLDVEAYRGVAAVFAMPRTTDAEKAERQERLQSALKAATGPPLRTMAVASKLAGLARELVEIGNTSAISDVGSAAYAVQAGFHAAFLNVEINIGGVRDEEWVAAIRMQLAAIPSPDQATQEVTARVLSFLGSGAG
jgi:formiminotetrahydrofolate cyclodeaminase